MSLIEKWIYEKVVLFYRQRRLPVPTVMVAADVGKNERYIRLYLARLEASGYIERKGQRGGWYPVHRGMVA